MHTSPTPLLRPLSLALCLWIAASPALAESGTPTSTREGSHVIRQGDTLESLAQRYLGSSQYWRDIWELNPELANPHFLRPGNKLILPFRQLPDEGAFLSKLSNQVQQWRPPLAQEKAAIFDVLQALDQVETGKRSSAEIAFPDSSFLRLNEESRIILDPPHRLGTTVERNQVELVTGQVDLEGEQLSGDPAIQLVIGDATAAPETSDTGELRTRARMQEKTAQLMVYSGSSELEAGGEKVAVEEGMGSSVKEGEAPTPPEELLPAPALQQPEADAQLATPRPGFSWSGLDGAQGYTVEVCFDPECGELERRLTGLSETSWKPEEGLPKNELYWRVTAAGSSGLDGYPSDPRMFRITTDREDEKPPSVAFKVDGTHLAPRYGLNRHWILGRGALFEAHADDSESGLDKWIPLLDGEEVSPQAWSSGPWQAGVEHEASFIALDRAANRAELEPVPFKFDDQPPTLTWGLEQVGPQGSLEPPASVIDGLPWNSSRHSMEVNDPHSWWPWRKQIWTLDRDSRQILLRPNRPVRVLVNGATEVVLGPERGLWVLAEDAICEVIDRLDYRSGLEVEGGLWKKKSILSLDIEARDPVENRVQGVLKLETLGKEK